MISMGIVAVREGRYPAMAAYTSLLKICCLAANIVLLYVSRSLPSNGSTPYNIFSIYSQSVLFLLGFLTEILCKFLVSPISTLVVLVLPNWS
jgi:hypothetical protein